MRSINLGAGLAFTLCFPLLILGQQAPESVAAKSPCEVRIIFDRTPEQIEIGTTFGRSDDVLWWRSAQQRFPNFCRVFDPNEADFVIQWTSMERTETKLVSPLNSNENGVPTLTPERNRFPGDPTSSSRTERPPDSGASQTGYSYKVQTGRVQVFALRDGVVQSKPIFKSTSSTEKRAFGPGILPLHFLTAQLFEGAMKALTKKAKEMKAKH
jgi:hypothetical protein